MAQRQYISTDDLEEKARAVVSLKESGIITVTEARNLLRRDLSDSEEVFGEVLKAENDDLLENRHV